MDAGDRAMQERLPRYEGHEVFTQTLLNKFAEFIA
jgi:hypothetical protein